MKKLFALVLALTMVVTLCASASALTSLGGSVRISYFG